LEKGDANHGFDAQSGTYVDMGKAGIMTRPRSCA